jgi:hypothetical protein
MANMVPAAMLTTAVSEVREFGPAKPKFRITGAPARYENRLISPIDCRVAIGTVRR